MNDTPQKNFPDKQEKTGRDDKGRFTPGTSGNPEGRPAFSITEMIKKKLQEISPGNKKTYLENLIIVILNKAIVQQDEKMLKLIWNYMDGMPKQDIKVRSNTIVDDILEKAGLLPKNDKSEISKDS